MPCDRAPSGEFVTIPILDPRLRRPTASELHDVAHIKLGQLHALLNASVTGQVLDELQPRVFGQLLYLAVDLCEQAMEAVRNMEPTENGGAHGTH